MGGSTRAGSSYSRSQLGKLDKKRRTEESTNFQGQIVDYSGPEKPEEKKAQPAQLEEDARNPVTFKSKIDIRKTDFDLYDATQLVLGPTSNAPNYSYFTTRIEKVYIFMLLLCMFSAMLVAVILFTHFILPDFTYAKDVLKTFLGSKKVPVIFHSSIPPLLMYLAVLFNVAVVQYHKTNSWQKFAPIRWVIFISVEIYLLAAAAYFVSQTVDFTSQIETTMRKDWDFKYRNVKNDPSISSVYRFIVGSRMEQVQVYYRCCGVDTWKDWKPVMKHWKHTLGKKAPKYIHGNLCSIRYTEDIPWKKSEFAKNKKICQVPHTCWVKGKVCSRVKDKYDNAICYTGITKVWDDSCLYAEVALAYSVASVYIFFLVFLMVFSSFVFWKTRSLIEIANKMKVDLYTRPQFEECL